LSNIGGFLALVISFFTMIGVVDFNQLLNKVANRIKSKQNSEVQQDS
jgi:hypothetical protein